MSQEFTEFHRNSKDSPGIQRVPQEFKGLPRNSWDFKGIQQIPQEFRGGSVGMSPSVVVGAVVAVVVVRVGVGVGVRVVVVVTPLNWTPFELLGNPLQSFDFL